MDLIQQKEASMNEKIINDIGNKIYKLRGVTVTNNYSDNRNLDLLVQNLMSVQRMLINDNKFTKSTKYLSVLEKETEYFLTRYGK